MAAGSVGHFLTPQPLPERLLFVEPLRRRMRARQGDEWIADSDNVVAFGRSHDRLVRSDGDGRWRIAERRAEVEATTVGAGSGTGEASPAREEGDYGG